MTEIGKYIARIKRVKLSIEEYNSLLEEGAGFSVVSKNENNVVVDIIESMTKDLT